MTDEAPVVTSMSITTHLPCGHTLRLGAESSIELVSPESAGKAASVLGATLSYWLVDRTRYHKCELVSASNPNGTEQRAGPPRVVTPPSDDNWQAS